MMEMVARCSGPEILETLLAADLRPMEAATAARVATAAEVAEMEGNPNMVTSANRSASMVLNA